MNRHDTDVLSLAFGLVFAAVVGGWLLLRWVSVSAPGAGWIVAAALIVLGALGVLATVRSARQHDATEPEAGGPPRP